MAHIQHRKHAVRSGARFPSHAPVAGTLGLMLAALPGLAAAQAAEPAKSTQAAPKEEQVLPSVKVKSAADNAYKADTVASPKFTQPLVDTPQTIAVIKKEVLQQQAATSLSEALRNTPGITLQLGENGNTTTGDSIFMRGFDTTNSIFVDGIRDLGNISRDVFNIEQVEVVKGPSGSDNGRGASSGYVNMVSKTASLEAFGNASVSLGDANRLRATVDLNRPLDIGIEGSALRLNLLAQDMGTPGRDEVKSKRIGFAPSLALGLGTPTRTYLSYLYVNQRNRPDGGVPTYGLPGYLPSSGTFVGPKVDPSNYYGALSDFDNSTLNMFTARIEHDLAPGTTLRNTTRLGSTEQDYVLTGVNAIVTQPTAGNLAAGTVARSRQGRHQVNQILTNQTNLSTEFNTGTVKHSLSTGFEFIHESQNQQNAQSLTNTTLPASLQQQVANLYAPSTSDTFLTPPYKGAYTKGSTLTAAVYAFDTLKLSEQWLVNGGVRLEKFHTETNGATFTAATATTAESLVQNAPASLTDTLTSWKLGAVFKPLPNGSVYATVSNAFQPPGGANFALGAGQASTASQPQQGSNIELGTKWDLFGGRLAATGAIYRSQNKNEVLNFGTNAAPDYRQLGKRRVDGVELGLVGQLTPALNLSAGYAYMDPKILVGLPTNQGGVIVYSPKQTFTSWLSYKLPLGVTLGGGVRYVDTVARSSNVVAATSNVTNIDAYWVADAMLGYQVTKNFGLQLNVYNLFDKQYVASVNNGGSRYVPGQPRNALLTANLAF